MTVADGVESGDTSKGKRCICQGSVAILWLIPFVDLAAAELDVLLTPFDLKRLESYANNSLDYHVILDLLPTIAALYFDRRLGSDVRLSAVQSAILLGLGLQRKTVEQIEVRMLAVEPNRILTFISCDL